MPPHFRQPLALPGCDKKLLRWPGPFGFGFLSPQPPGIVGIGPIAGSKRERYRVSVIEDQRELVLFVFQSLYFGLGFVLRYFEQRGSAVERGLPGRTDVR